MPTLGIPIEATKANEYLQQNAVIKDKIRPHLERVIKKNKRRINRRSLGIAADATRAKKAKYLCNDLNNAYLFSKEDFDRFFVNDPASDEPNHNLHFTHCMIIVGSLPANDGHKKPGEQTIVIAGCTQVPGTETYITAADDGTSSLKSLKRVATEHPPRDYAVNIENPVAPSVEKTLAINLLP